MFYLISYAYRAYLMCSGVTLHRSAADAVQLFVGYGIIPRLPARSQPWAMESGSDGPSPMQGYTHFHHQAPTFPVLGHEGPTMGLYRPDGNGQAQAITRG